MFELFENLTNWLWGLPLLITILATGVYLTVRSGFFQFRHFQGALDLTNGIPCRKGWKIR